MAITLDGTVGVTSPDFIPSSSNIPTNGLFLPAANTVGLATGSTERLRIDSSGNLGLGVTPSGWSSAFKAFQGYGGFLASNGSAVQIAGANAYSDGTNWRYIATAAASFYAQVSGVHSWSTAPSGTAGNAISFTQAMTLDASGRLGIGTSSPTSPFEVAKSASIDNAGAANKWVARLRDTTATAAGVGGGLLFQGIKAASGSVGNFAAIAGLKENATDNNENGYLAFFTTPNATGLLNERARIDSSGNLLVGTTTSQQKLTVAGGSYISTSSPGNNLAYFENSSTTGYGLSVFCNSSNSTQRYFEGYSSSATAQKVAIYTDGNVRIAAGSTYGNLSDASLKTNIVDASPKLADVCALKVRNFSTLEDSTSKFIGFIAQEFEEVFPSLVTTSTDVYKDGREVKGVKESALIPILVKAIQELTTRLEALENK